MATRYSINDINKIAHRKFFFDANVLLYLHYTTTTKWQVNAYSNLFSNLLTYKPRLLIDSHILSEFINTALRIEYKNFKTDTGSDIEFKGYRNSPEGQRALNHIYGLAKIILKQFSIDGHPLSNTALENMLTRDSLDFNDKIIEKHCIDKGYILVTNDLDFRDSSVEILTANRNFGI